MPTVFFNNIDHFQPFRSLSGHSRVTLLMLDDQLNFECFMLQGLSLTLGLFQGYIPQAILDFIASLENHRKSLFEFFGSY